MSRYRFVSAMKAEGFAIEAACTTAEVSTSAYYAWLAKVTGGPTEAEWDEALLINEIVDVHRHLVDTYGSPRMTEELRARGFCANHKRVERVMAENGLHAKDGRRRKVRTTIPDVSAPPLPDLVQREFSVGEPGGRTCGDITYIPTDEGWLYLAGVLDLGSRRVVGYAMDERMPTALVISAMDVAITTGRPGRGHGVPSRPREPVPRQGVPGVLRAPRHRPVRRADRIEPGQRRRRVFLGHPQARARLPLPLRHQGRRPSGDHRLDQPPQRRAPARVDRQRVADRVGATLRQPSTSSRIAMCPADGGKAEPLLQPMCTKKGSSYDTT